MNRSLGLLSVLVLGCTAKNPQAASPAHAEQAPPLTSSPSATGYQPFPSGYHYMEDTAQLAQAVKDGNRSAVRTHGWYLWAGIMQPAEGATWPLWITWPNTTMAFQPSALTSVKSQRAVTLLAANAANAATSSINTTTPFYPLPQETSRSYPKGICKNESSGALQACDGQHFQNNGDIMIATESLSQEAYAWIRGQKLYQSTTLDDAHRQGVHLLEAPQRHIVTKHMYWPVKQQGLSALPVWHEDFPPGFPDYAGYERWKTVVAVDPAGQRVGTLAPVTWLYGVKMPDKRTPMGPFSAQAKVVGLNEFYSHQVTEADWASFDDGDKAILDAASRWAHNKPFEPGDYLVTIAMHVNTKEISTWALQSVWWSDTPELGPYAEDRPAISNAAGPWKHYLLTEAYGIPVADGSLGVSMNPYIELASHPVATNCNNCHMRAGWPNGAAAGQASYQNPDCPDALQRLTPGSACLQKLTRTDFQWIIPDRAQ